MSEDKSLEENFETANARITPGVTIGGMGEVSLPNAENGNIGSGDVPDVADIDDDEEEAKKDKTKKKLEMEGFKLFTQFNNFITESLSEGASNFKVLLKTAKEESIGRKVRLGDKKDPGNETWEKIDATHWMNLKTEEKLDLNKWAKHADNFNMEGKDLQFENLTESDSIYEAAVLENAVRDLHFETDPKTAEEMKIAIGASQGEVVPRKQIEGGNYSLRRFRKEIKYDETGEDLGVFKPGSYMAATSKLGDGPHKKAVKKVRWNQKMYDQWLEDVASNGGWEHAFDMAQNAKHERGLIDWVKKNHRGEDPMQRIQWDIEAFAESVVSEAKGFKNTTDFEKFLIEIDGMRESQIKKIMGKDYIDTPGFYQDEKGNYDNDIIEFMISNMGDSEFEKLKSWWETNVAESVVTEKLARGLKPLLILGSILKKNAGEDTLLDLSDKFDALGDEDADNIASYLNMAIELMQDGYGKSATEKLKQFNKACKDALAGKEVGSAFESVAKDRFSKWCKLNEAKSINRDEMMKWIEKYMDFVGTTEDFSGSQGGIHVSGEDGDEYKGSVIYSYYSEDYKNREFGVWNKWEKELNKRGWYSEWYDAGTVCIWPL